MKKKLFALITSVFIFFVFAGCVFAENIPSSVKEAADSAVKLTINTNFGTKNATAFAVGKKSDSKYLVTNLWAIDGYTGDIFVKADDMEEVCAVVIAVDETKNIAVLELKDELEGLKPVKFKAKNAKDETEIYTLAYTATDNDDLILTGSIQCMSTFSSGEMSADIYQLTIAVDGTNNGALLCDKRGNALGLCFYDGNTDINKAITAQMVMDVLDSNNIEYKKTSILFPALIILIVLLLIALIVWKALEILKEKQENSPSLIGRSGDFASQRIALTSENICIGRDAKICQVVLLNDAKVSRCHCSIHYDKQKGKFVLTDLSSTHGTYINGKQKLEPNVPVYLSSGSTFSLGSSMTEFIVSEGGAFI